jgi:hypothetical protein
MRFRYLIISGIVWGKNEITKEYFVNAIHRGDTIIDLQEGKQFDPEKNEWVDVEGD